MPPDELTADVLYQIGALDGIARAAGGRVSYVKPHGALYNRVVSDPVQAAAVAEAVAAVRPGAAGADAARLGVLRRPREAGLTVGRRGLRRPRLHPARRLVPRRSPAR